MSNRISFDLEGLVRRALNTGWGGLGGIAKADYIDMDGGAFHAIIAALAPYYKDAGSDTQAEISNFIHKYRFLSTERVRDHKEDARELIRELDSLLDKLGAI